MQSIKPGITLPYWDWTIDWKVPEDTVVLSPKMFGTNGNSKNCVSDGIENGWIKKFPNETCLKRDYRYGNSTGSFWPMYAVNSLIEKKSNFEEFSSNIENGCHGIVHLGLGGDFSKPWAPQDALFFLHHSMVDMIWALWQARDITGSRYSDINGILKNGDIATMDTVLPYYNKSISTQMNTLSLVNCYIYEEFMHNKAFVYSKRNDKELVYTYPTNYNSHYSRNGKFGKNNTFESYPQIQISSDMKSMGLKLTKVNEMNEFVRNAIAEMVA
ncbi:hypothetical protein BB559_001867 [Furculomyces boomerangus]|uniref:Tyrosinase copper-binding domain-containing protein n=1 Tax=Furculomyces boomerangus TaxID=61424 RepID=A0A2T9Z019_9FUNG|nr:hypothetical protein BB559_001867 [Furculomyces boomerangus]